MSESDSYIDRGIAEAISQSADQPVVGCRGRVTPAQARSSIAAVDRIAGRLHQDMIASRPRSAFMHAWEQFYNRWIAYKVLDADRVARADPGRVVENDLPVFVQGLLAWRDALKREGGKVRVGEETASAVPPTTTKRRWTVWHVMGALTGGWLAYKGYKWLTAVPDEPDRPVLPNPAPVAPSASTFPVIPPIVVYPPPAPLYAASPRPYDHPAYLPPPRTPYPDRDEDADGVFNATDDDREGVIDVEV